MIWCKSEVQQELLCSVVHRLLWMLVVIGSVVSPFGADWNFHAAFPIVPGGTGSSRHDLEDTLEDTLEALDAMGQ